ncbi:MAG TPA: hypothetical protein VE891_11305 [Allosphingosinicella sp.]|nr:hypothetical protein [Allosphingosinicella sp.]
MAERESELAMVRRHVAEGERHVSLQRNILARLRHLGGSTVLADQLLTEFEHTLRTHREHLGRIEASKVAN